MGMYGHGCGKTRVGKWLGGGGWVDLWGQGRPRQAKEGLELTEKGHQRKAVSVSRRPCRAGRPTSSGRGQVRRLGWMFWEVRVSGRHSRGGGRCSGHSAVHGHVGL